MGDYDVPMYPRQEEGGNPLFLAIKDELTVLVHSFIV